MANAPTVVTNATGDTPRIGNVLDGLKFFVVQRVPRRTGLMKDIEANGGEIVRHEVQSDYVIADHFRRDAPGGSYSYTFIDSAIKNQRLPDPADHAIGGTLRSDRPVGSVIPGKHTRTPFTVQDDKDLWEFVEEAKQDGASVKGNDVYKQLEKVHPRHTFQAWRDRYIKKLLDKPPPPGARAPTATMVLPTSPTDAPRLTTEAPLARQATATLKRKRKVKVAESVPEVEHERSSLPKSSTAQPEAPTTKIADAELALLVDNVDDIEDIPKERWGRAWSGFQQAHPHRTAEEWSNLYLTHVRPLHRKETRETAVARYEGPDDQDDTRLDGMSQGNKGTGKGPNRARGNGVVRSTSSTPTGKKRKRTNPASSPIACAASHKRQKAGPTDRDAMVNEENILTSDLVCDAEQQVQVEADTATHGDPTSHDVKSDALLTSDANMAADRQLFGEASAHKPDEIELLESDGVKISGRLAGLEDATVISKTPALPNNRVDTDSHRRRLEEQSDRDLLTSEANQGADEQLCQIILDDDSEVGSQLDVDDSPIFPKEIHFEAQSTSATSGHSMPAKHALTEANLASQQAQHKPCVPRAFDLHHDEEEKDQSDFIDYLQTTLSNTKASRGADGATSARVHSNGLRLDHVPPNFWRPRPPSSRENGDIRAPAADTSQRKPPENIYMAQMHRRQQEEASIPISRTAVDEHAAEETKQDSPEVAEELVLEQDLPMSSEQELEDALDENLNWPASPQHKHAQKSSQSQPFETQIAYPRLDLSTHGHTGLAAPDFQLLSQSMMSQHDDGEENFQATPTSSFKQQRPVSKASVRVVREKHDYDDHARDKSVALNPLLQDDTVVDEDDGAGYDGAVAAQDDTINHEPYDADDDVDLTVVEPDGGFLAPESPAKEPINDPRGAANGKRRTSSEPITISSAAPSSSPYEASQDGKACTGLEQRSAGVSKRALETQDILNAETQLPEFSMPEPSLPDDHSDGDEADETQLHAPAVRTAQAATRSQRTRADKSDSDESTTDVDSWILSMKAHGFSDKAISKALRCTSYRPHIAQLVLFEEKRGNGLPDDTPGIWNKLEDEVLEGGDARKLRRLYGKHGSVECDARLDFLSQWRELFPAKS